MTSNTVLIIGTRGFIDKACVCAQVSKVPANWTVSTGNTRKVDEWVKSEADLKGLDVQVISTEWGVHDGDCKCDSGATYCRMAGYRSANRMVSTAACAI